MSKLMRIVTVTLLLLTAGGIAQEPMADVPDDYPWCGKYPIGFFTKTRTSNTVPKGKTNVLLKFQPFDWDRKQDARGDYQSPPPGQSKEQLALTFIAKHGLTDDFQLGFGVPYLINDFDLGNNSNDSQGVGNIFLFQKWNFIRETNHFPGIAADFWYFMPTGDSDRGLGSDKGSYSITAEISKAWKDFSLHFNPGYTWSQAEDCDAYEVNAAILFKPFKTLWPAVEYNYCDHESKGQSHDLVTGVIWKCSQTSSVRVGLVNNLQSTRAWKDRCGIVFKICHLF